MSTRMLIDARHIEETRVAVVKGNKVEDFDYESSNKVQIKGNIYLAKITRVEPSLQAAFVDYGGNRHGFLAFSEIHPDYYQIPVEDREALLAEEAALAEQNNNVVEAEILDAGVTEEKDTEVKDTEAKEATDVAEAETPEAEANAAQGAIEMAETIEASDTTENTDIADVNADVNADDSIIEAITEEDEDEELVERLRLRQLRQLKRRYKIQEVIKPRQIILIQVVKEERGNKGAALTSYISLAGRYTVLMPNTTHGGGISRKISSATDRKRLKSVVDSLDIPSGTGCIIRTAGMKRTKTEIKRDVEYIQKIWSNIRALTLKSVAPSIVYEEGNLIKRAIRDLYDRSIDEVQVEGEEGYKMAKEFMTLLMPSHAKRIHHYKDGLPLFQRYQVEEQLDGIFNPTVTLKSGGYLVINPTEALISIDVNSGKSTKQHNIESTAFKTNLEAATEIGRQLRLRDLAGLVVIDFIDMEERSHNRKVETKMKDAVKADRARIMVNRISSLGLMEISRQRLRPNLEEASTEMCIHCEGSGRIRNKESAALHVLRAIENEGYKGNNSIFSVALNPEVAFYVLNHKRKDLISLENKYGIQVELNGDSSLISPKYTIAASGAAPTNTNIVKLAPISNVVASDDDEDENKQTTDGEDTTENKPKRRRRRGGRGRGKYGRNRFQDENGDNIEKSENADNRSENQQQTADNINADVVASETNDNQPKDDDGSQKPRRRGRRGGRRSRYSRGDKPQEGQDSQQTPGAEATGATQETGANVEATSATATPEGTPKPQGDKPQGDKPQGDKPQGDKPKRRPRARKPANADAKPETSGDVQTEVKPADEKPKRRSRAKKPVVVEAGSDTAPKTEPKSDVKAEEKPKKTPARRKTATSKVKIADDDKQKADTKKPAKAKTNVAKAKPANDVAPETKVKKAPSKTPEKVSEKADDKPKKRGWWQRNTAE